MSIPANYTILLASLFFDFVRWPLWWYTTGLKKTVLWAATSVVNEQERLGLGIWIKNIFTPMFGQYDLEGRIISFVIRLVQILFRGAVMMFWILFCCVAILAWLVIPPLVILLMLLNIFFGL